MSICKFKTHVKNCSGTMEKSLDEIDSLRNRLGIAQADMCRVADVSESTVSRARAAQRQPTKRIRRKLAAALEEIARDRGVTVIENIDEGDKRQ
jgi:predicted transcriptional regulator